MCSSDVVRFASEGAEAGATSGIGAMESRSGGTLSPDLFRSTRAVQDLTHSISRDFPVFPGEQHFESTPTRTLEQDGYAGLELRFAEHSGTHLDAPAHFFAAGETADQISAVRLIAPLVVISMEDRTSRDHDAAMSVDEIASWERKHGKIPAGAVVAMHSGWEERLTDPSRYINLDDSGVMHTPGFGKEAAEFLVRERGVAGIAVDTLSLDIGASSAFEAHRVVLGAGCYGLENVANLDRVPPSGATLVVGGPNHHGATGGPARLLAFY